MRCGFQRFAPVFLPTSGPVTPNVQAKTGQRPLPLTLRRADCRWTDTRLCDPADTIDGMSRLLATVRLELTLTFYLLEINLWNMMTFTCLAHRQILRACDIFLPDQNRIPFVLHFLRRIKADPRSAEVDTCVRVSQAVFRELHAPEVRAARQRVRSARSIKASE